MSINFNHQLGTYVAQDSVGQVVGIYSPQEYGDIAGFRNAMARLND
ncbi:hypothetical protein [Lysobacter capsici]|nr:hypothetical protein [Lysobacter capsici]QWF18727.1 hypothetical protein KME82_08285 [Lysobacter capsici]